MSGINDLKDKRRANVLKDTSRYRDPPKPPIRHKGWGKGPTEIGNLKSQISNSNRRQPKITLADKA